jgi:hypothetical protein
LKKNYPNDWCLILDEDEIVEDLQKIKNYIQLATPGLYDVKMRHFIGDLGHEDATRPIHFVPRRLFKISEAIKYPEHSHPVLEGEFIAGCLATTIWHLGHLPVEYMDYILRRYKQHAKDSIIHTQDFLKQWKMAHLLGLYPNSQINPIELPKQICDRYEIDKDEFYFANRGLESKHFIDAKHWKDFFKCKTAIEWGCGLGPRVYALQILDIDAKGFDISDYAINHRLCDKVWKGDITKIIDANSIPEHDLVIAYDVLEHLDYKDLDKAITNLILNSNKYILVSVPVIGDPNLEADKTHKIKETKEWWLNKFCDVGLKQIPTPEHFLFKEQIMIFEK